MCPLKVKGRGKEIELCFNGDISFAEARNFAKLSFKNVTVKEYFADDVLISELALNQDFSFKKYT